MATVTAQARGVINGYEFIAVRASLYGQGCRRTYLDAGAAQDATLPGEERPGHAKVPERADYGTGLDDGVGLGNGDELETLDFFVSYSLFFLWILFSVTVKLFNNPQLINCVIYF